MSLWETLCCMLGGVPNLGSGELRQAEAQARLPKAHGGVGLLSTRDLSPIAYLGSFALAAPALESQFLQHGESLSIEVCNVEMGSLPTQLALTGARGALHARACEVLPPFDTVVSLSFTLVQTSRHTAYSARLEEVLAGAGSARSKARIRSTRGEGTGHWLQC